MIYWYTIGTCLYCERDLWWSSVATFHILYYIHRITLLHILYLLLREISPARNENSRHHMSENASRSKTSKHSLRPFAKLKATRCSYRIASTINYSRSDRGELSYICHQESLLRTSMIEDAWVDRSLLVDWTHMDRKRCKRSLNPRSRCDSIVSAHRTRNLTVSVDMFNPNVA